MPWLCAWLYDAADYNDYLHLYGEDPVFPQFWRSKVRTELYTATVRLPSQGTHSHLQSTRVCQHPSRSAKCISSRSWMSTRVRAPSSTWVQYWSVNAFQQLCFHWSGGGMAVMLTTGDSSLGMLTPQLCTVDGAYRAEWQ